jgi:hypothetical protein
VSGQVTRTRILRVALDLASAEGFCRITFGSVAGRASLSKSGVAAHLPHLGDLRRLLGGPQYGKLFSAEKRTSFVNQNPPEPTTEGAFALEA